MKRLLPVVLSPEIVLLGIATAVFAICERHGSGEGADLTLMERLVWLLPLLTMPPVFATVLTPGGRSWWWLARAVIFTFVMLGVCALRIVEGFGPGARGQDAALIIVLLLGVIAVSAGTAASGAFILASQRPAFDQWVRRRKVLATLAVLLAAVLIAIALGVTLSIVLGFLGGLWSAFGG